MALHSSQNLNDSLSLTDALEFFILKKLLHIHTLTLAKIISINENKTRMTVQSLINNVSNDNMPHSAPLVYDVPCCSMRGGNAGLIIEYEINDNVLIGYCERQIDSIKRTQCAQTPSLIQTHSLEDAIIIAHWSNTPPAMYVKIIKDKIEIQAVDKPITIITTGTTIIKAENATIEANKLATIKAPLIKLDGKVEATSITTSILTAGTTTINSIGVISSSGDLNINGKPFLLHTHGNGNNGNPTTEVL